MKVIDKSIVTLEYVMMDHLGEVLESSKVDGEYDYLHGIGEMLPGVEKALSGLEKGNSIDIVVPPEDGFGIKNDEFIFEVDKDIFSEDSTLESGMEFDVEDEDGANIITIVELRGDKVLVDKNHPLAGETLKVKAKILDVRMAEDWEIKHWDHNHEDHDHENCDH
ncbi:MAG: FKBP-type peptidyl-prolyl cis-trans isomerase [Spirochaetia bacterium]|jgi:FKBP-type peptidyl-prolyl cis-trans isomerase SlyD|nr:FKBP-type peptidyl-prolyl cis-trans isomerase [Spirochaetia bacterium]